jgi:hypothetical protein
MLVSEKFDSIFELNNGCICCSHIEFPWITYSNFSFPILDCSIFPPFWYRTSARVTLNTVRIENLNSLNQIFRTKPKRENTPICLTGVLSAKGGWISEFDGVMFIIKLFQILISWNSIVGPKSKWSCRMKY